MVPSTWCHKMVGPSALHQRVIPLSAHRPSRKPTLRKARTKSSVLALTTVCVNCTLQKQPQAQANQLAFYETYAYNRSLNDNSIHLKNLASPRSYHLLSTELWRRLLRRLQLKLFKCLNELGTMNETKVWHMTWTILHNNIFKRE